MFHKSHTLRRALLTAFAVILLCSAGAAAQEDQPTPGERIVIVDINSAPLEEIRGIVLDDLLAERIIENRPYANKRQLVSRRVVTEEHYEEIKDRIVARRVAQAPEQ